MLESYLENPRLWIPVVILVCVVLIWISYDIFGDSNARRRRTARRLLALASRFRQGQTRESSQSEEVNLSDEDSLPDDLKLSVKQNRDLLKKFWELSEEIRESITGFTTDELISGVESDDRFTSCYSANVLGQLASEFPEKANRMLDALAKLLLQDDKFRRHAAAQALYMAGPPAISKISEIQQAAEKFSEESAGAIASRLVERLNHPESWRSDY
jgi:hypothetical protein